jgi:hypothetical protein
VRRARFPFLKTVDDFNFLHQSTVRLSLLGSALASEFVAEGRCVILSGKPGRGKTHLAVAIAYRAIQNGFSSVGDCSPSTGRRCGPSTSDLTTRPHLGHQINRPEFPESSGQNFRNPRRLRLELRKLCLR